MNILMISNDVRILNSESETARRMVEYGTLVDRISIIVLGGAGEPMTLSSNVVAYPLRGHKLFAPFFVGRLVRNAGVSDIDLVTAQDPFWAGLVGYCAAKAVGGRLQLQVHTDPASIYFQRASFLNRLRWMLARFLLPKADCLRVVSNRIAESLRPFVRGHVPVAVIITSFVDIDRLRAAHTTIDLRERYADYKFIILMASRLTVEKDFPMALAALEEVVRDFPKTLLLVVGEGPERESIEKEVQRRNLVNNVRFEGWADDLTSYYKTADLFLMTSHFEGNSRALIEAVAAGCPCVTTNVGAASDFDNLSRVSVGDAEALADIVRTAIITPLQPTPLPAWVPRSREEHLRRSKESWQRCCRSKSEE